MHPVRSMDTKKKLIMNKGILKSAVVILLAVSCANPRYDVTLSSLLDEMISRETLAEYPSIEYRAAQVSSYDRRTVSKNEPGWWANDDGAGYERLDTVSGRIEKVMCELEGPGVVTRIWMTTKEKYGTMRIYLDGAEEAQIIIPAYDMKRFPLNVPAALSLTHTHYVTEMEGVGGNTFFLPIPYQKACKITFEEPDINVKIPRYYHIGYRSYPEGTKVKTFTLKEAERLIGKMNSVSEELFSPKEYKGNESAEKKAGLKPNDNLELILPTGSKTVTELSVETDNMESLWITASFDGVQTVCAPLAHFAGSGIGAPDTKGWWLTKSGDKAICRFFMPYKNSAVIKLSNTGSEDTSVSVSAKVADYVWTANSLYFHASFKSENGIPVSPHYDSDNNLDWNFTTIKGRGVYVGDLLSLNNHAIDWYGEGDEKIYVDDDVFPSFMGTGTEDYYNCSWAPVVPFTTPFGGAPRADEESSHGFNAFLRTRNLDVIPFSRSFVYDLEMLSWHSGTVDYNATAFWYGDIDTKSE